MPTFGDLVSHLQDHFSTGAPSAGRYLRYLNEWHRRLLTGPGGELYRLQTLTVSAAAGATSVSLPVPFSAIDHVVNLTTNLPMEERSLAWFRSLPPNSVTTGLSFAYVVRGMSPAAADPGGAGVATYVVSTAAADTSQKVTVTVLLANGTTATASATLTGATPVQVGTWTTATTILQFQLQSVATGTVTLQNVGATVFYGSIGIGTLSSQRFRLMLAPTPSAAISLQVDGQRLVIACAATDEPWIPEEWHYLLETGARCLEYEKEADTRLASTRAELEHEIKRFRFFCCDRPDAKKIPGQRGVATGSSLGPWYPAGRW